MSSTVAQDPPQFPLGPKPVLVTTCGNAMGGNDAFGPMVAAILQQRPLRGMEVLDLGANPALLLDHLEGRKMLLIVDAAVAAGLRPGQLLDLSWQEAQDRLHLASRSLSSHALSLANQLALAEATHQLPQFVRLVVLIIPNAEFGCPSRALLLSRAVAAANQIRRHAKLHLLRAAFSC
jgi:hydrogenase maturation protease